MGQQNGFGSGFIIGSVIGAVVGGVLGTVLASEREKQGLVTNNSYKLKKAPQSDEISFSTEESIELARHGLEDKIAQLNLAIDDVRQQLGTVKTPSEQD
jgi:gas vesicle protein